VLRYQSINLPAQTDSRTLVSDRDLAQPKPRISTIHLRLAVNKTWFKPLTHRGSAMHFVKRRAELTIRLTQMSEFDKNVK
jgi:hypothetical protein